MCVLIKDLQRSGVNVYANKGLSSHLDLDSEMCPFLRVRQRSKNKALKDLCRFYPFTSWDNLCKRDFVQ